MPDTRGSGPVAAILAEDHFGVADTAAHLGEAGFGEIFVLSREPIGTAGAVHSVVVDDLPDYVELTNALIARYPGRWLHVCHGGEFLYAPFSEARSVADALAFATDERRVSLFAVTVDLYKDAVDLEDAALKATPSYFDRSGYYSVWPDQAAGHGPQILVYGGLRWRFAPFVPEARQRLNRPGLFKAREGLTLGPDMWFNDAEYNSVSCTWHNSMTAAVASFRAARALGRNPSSRAAISQLTWGLSERFDWTSDQLMRAGFMEPGQWF
jgi:hypothetical protein